MGREFAAGLGYGLLAIISIAIIGGLVFAWYCFSVPGRSHEGDLPALSAEEAALAERLRTHIATIAAEPHNTANIDALLRVETYLDAALSAAGHAVHRQAFQADGHEVANLEVVIEPVAKATSTIVVGAHYDSAGLAPGANDNATGAAALLELAGCCAISSPPPPGSVSCCSSTRSRRTSRPRRWGSLVYARALAKSGENLRGMICLETIGAFSDAPGSQTYPPLLDRAFPDRANFVAIAGTLGRTLIAHEVIAAFRKHAAFPSVGGVLPGFVPGIDWSDHWSFGEAGFPAVMITDTALYRYPHYHTAEDTVDKVDVEALARITRGVERVIRELAR